MSAYIEELDLQVVEYSGVPDRWQKRNINEEAYSRFINRYIKRKNSTDSPFWKVVRADLGASGP